MTCRAPTNSQACSGTPTGQALSYDAMERLVSWQNAQSSPTTTAAYGYDGAGHRVEQQVTTSGTTTTTTYIGSYEEVSVTGSTTTTTKYYATPACTALSVNGTLSYVLGNGLHSVSVALSSSGSITATQLFTPYGSSRYSTGTMPTSKGFTGQRLDPSGLNYFNARYYDSSVGQFISADVAQGPNRYAYVGGNPETLTDPTGKYWGDGRCSSAGIADGICIPPGSWHTPKPPPSGTCRHENCTDTGDYDPLITPLGCPIKNECLKLIIGAEGERGIKRVIEYLMLEEETFLQSAETMIQELNQKIQGLNSYIWFGDNKVLGFFVAEAERLELKILHNHIDLINQMIKGQMGIFNAVISILNQIQINDSQYVVLLETDITQVFPANPSFGPARIVTVQT